MQQEYTDEKRVNLSEQSFTKKFQDPSPVTMIRGGAATDLPDPENKQRLLPDLSLDMII